MDQDQSHNKGRFEAIVSEFKKHPLYVFILILLALLAAWNNLVGVGIINKIGDSDKNNITEAANKDEKNTREATETSQRSNQSLMSSLPSEVPSRVTDTAASLNASRQAAPNTPPSMQPAPETTTSTPAQEEIASNNKSVFLRVDNESKSINYTNTISKYIEQNYTLSQEKNSHLSIIINIKEGNAHSIEGAQTKGIASFESCPRFSVQIKNNDTQTVEKQVPDEKLCSTSNGIPDSGTTAQNRAAAQVAQRILSLVTEVTKQGL